MTLALLTPYLCGGVLGDHGVGGELGVQDAPVGVRVHRQAVQQLAVLLHTLVGWGVSLRDQRSHCLWGQGRTPHTTHSQQDPFTICLKLYFLFWIQCHHDNHKDIVCTWKGYIFFTQSGTDRVPQTPCLFLCYHHRVPGVPRQPSWGLQEEDNAAHNSHPALFTWHPSLPSFAAYPECCKTPGVQPTTIRLCDPHFPYLHWLHVVARIWFKKMVLAYKAVNRTVPAYLQVLVSKSHNHQLERSAQLPVH